MRVDRRDSEGGVEWVLRDGRPEHAAAMRHLQLAVAERRGLARRAERIRTLL